MHFVWLRTAMGLHAVTRIEIKGELKFDEVMNIILSFSIWTHLDEIMNRWR